MRVTQNVHSIPASTCINIRPRPLSGEKGDSVSAQLSLALLADALHDDARALKLHHRFNRRVVTLLPARWTITRSRILDYADLIEHLAVVSEEGE